MKENSPEKREPVGYPRNEWFYLYDNELEDEQLKQKQEEYVYRPLSYIRDAVCRDNPMSAYVISSILPTQVNSLPDDNWKSCILNRERLSCPARDVDH